MREPMASARQVVDATVQVAEVDLGRHLAAFVTGFAAQGQCLLIGAAGSGGVGLRLDLANRVQRHAHRAAVAQLLANGQRPPVRRQGTRVVLHLEQHEADVLVRKRLACLQP